MRAEERESRSVAVALREGCWPSSPSAAKTLRAVDSHRAGRGRYRSRR